MDSMRLVSCASSSLTDWLKLKEGSFALEWYNYPFHDVSGGRCLGKHADYCSSNWDLTYSVVTPGRVNLILK